MQKLIKGLHLFQQEIFRPRREFFEQLAEGQRPEALFITCSDSRINPNMLTQTEPGELFILRNAGNIVPAFGALRGGGEEATIEYAVGVLGVRDIIVCGHSHCGAMKAVLDPPDRQAFPSLARWLTHAESTRRIILENYAHLGEVERLTATVEENALVQLENLRTHPLVAAAVARKALRLHAWVYKIETGQVFTFDPTSGQYEPLTVDRPSLIPPLPVTRDLKSI
ncbi:MAG: carbonic anhydrase [Deltaproteobacteria bacterium]|nr:carbonic anhydrase [Deltaproteobacteria bacterium]